MRCLRAISTAVVLIATSAAAEPRPGQRITIVHRASTPSLGSTRALVTIDVLFVPGLEASNAAYRAVVGLAARHPTRIYARFFPRRLGSQQVLAPLLLAAQRHGQFFALMDAMTATVASPTASARSHAIAATGLDPEQLARAARDPAIAEQLVANDRRAFRTPVTQSVELVINGQPASTLPTPLNLSSLTDLDLESAYQVALVQARLAAAQGVTGPDLVRHMRRLGYCETVDELSPSPITYDWQLGQLLDSGTDCAAPIVRPAAIDDPPMIDSVAPPPWLLAAAIPVANAPMQGPRDAVITVTVACNLRGSNCRSQLSVLRSVVDIYASEVRLAWVPWIDLGAEIADSDVALASAAMCAAELGDGWPFPNDPVGVVRDPIAVDDLARWAHAAPSDVAQCLPDSIDRVRAMVSASERAGITQGPTVIIAGRAYVGGFIDARAAAVEIEHLLAPGLLQQLAPGP